MTLSRGFLISAIFALFFFASLIPASAGSAEGKRIFEERKCGACHTIDGPEFDRTIAERLGRKGPELWYAGSKFNPGFLVAWLADPRPIRPFEYNSIKEKNRGDHPRLSPPEALEVASFLVTLRSPAVKPLGVVPAVTRRGRILFSKRQSCYGCHRVESKRGNVVGGFTGPSLVGAAERLNPDWVYAYLADPEKFKGIKPMPDYSGVLDKDDILALAAYIATFR